MRKYRNLQAVMLEPGWGEEYMMTLFAIKDRLAEPRALSDDEEDKVEQKPRTYTLDDDGTAFVTIKGALYSDLPRWVTKYYDVYGYNLIREDVAALLVDGAVKRVVFVVNTPGGAVNGISQASDAISKLASVKPISVYNVGSIGSAGYWLFGAIKGAKIYSAKESRTGSIGVIVTHVSYQGMLEEDGIKVTEIKSDVLKAAGSPYKDLTDDEKAYIQKTVDGLYDVFAQHVVSNRPQVKESAMHGEMYLASEALQLGLIDAISAIDDAVLHFVSETPSGGNDKMYKVKDREQLEALLQDGVSLEDMELSDELAAELAEEERAAEEAANAADDAAGEPAAEETEEATDPEADEEQPSGSQASTETVLRKELREAAEEIGALKAQLATAQAQLQEVKGLKAIVAEVINTRRIGLGMAKISGMEDGSIQTLIKDFEAVSAQFAESWKIGGLAKTGGHKASGGAKGKVIPMSNVEAGWLNSATIK